MNKTSRSELEQWFLNEDIGGLNPLSKEFSYVAYYFDDYFYTESDNLAIYAKYDRERGLASYEKNIQCTKPDILLDMLMLADKLNRNMLGKYQTGIPLDSSTYLYFGRPTVDEQGNPLDNKHQIALIIEWCKKYGFPFFPENSKSKKKQAFPVLDKEIKFAYQRFLIRDFLYQLNEVYSVFRMYQLMCLVSTPAEFTNNGIDKNAKISLPNLSAKTGVKYVPLYDIPRNDYEKILLAKYRERPSLNFHEYDKNDMKISAKPDNIFDAAFYQILVYPFRTNLRYCKLCGKLFEAKHPNRRYCDFEEDGIRTCNSKKAHYQRTKKAKAAK